VQDTTTSTTASLLTKNSLVVNTAATNTTYSVNGVVKSGSGTLSITQSGAAIDITSGLGVDINGGASPVSIFQPSLQATKLRTNLTNHYYYPDYYADNNNTSGPISIPYPQVTNERMTLANYGVVQNNTWVPLGDPVNSPATGVVSFCQDSNGRVWTCGVGQGAISIRDNANAAPDLQTITLTGGSLNEAYCYYEDSGYMYIGGDFTQIDGNTQLQYYLTRFNMSSFPYTFDPMFDTSQFIEGFNGPVYTIASAPTTGNLYVGGGFTTFFPTTNTADCIAYITNPTSSPGSQSYLMLNGGANAKVNTLYWDPTTNYLHMGGDFTAVNSSSQFLNYGAYFDIGAFTWFDVGANSFNSIVMSIVPTQYGKLFYAGGFTTAPQPYNCYIDALTPSSAPEDTGLSGMTPFIYRNCVFGIGGANLAVLNNSIGVYVNQSFLVWIDNSNPTSFGASGDTSGLDLWDGDYKVGYTTTNRLYDQVILSDTCAFVGGGGVFKYLGVSYTTFTLSQTDTAQQFVGDPTNSFWVPVGGLAYGWAFS
jgi:hypothetical protein